MISNMDPNKKGNFTSADLAAVERDAGIVNNEQLMAAALFAKQLQTDLNSIKKAQVGDGVRVPDVDMSKVMPSEIFKTFRPAGGLPPRSVPQPPGPPPAPPPVFTVPDGYAPPPGPLITSATTVHVSAVQLPDKNQLEFDFDKKAKYDDVIAAIEKLENKLNIINLKLDALASDNKKKLNIAP